MRRLSVENLEHIAQEWSNHLHWGCIIMWRDPCSNFHSMLKQNNNEFMYMVMHRLLQELTLIASCSFCLVAVSLWNRKPISWWTLATSHFLDLKVSYNRISFGTQKNSSHSLLLCSCSTSLTQLVNDCWALDNCYVRNLYILKLRWFPMQWYTM